MVFKIILLAFFATGSTAQDAENPGSPEILILGLTTTDYFATTEPPIVDNDGWTEIHRAASNGDLSLVKALIESGQLSLQTKAGKSRSNELPIHSAAREARINVMKWMVGQNRSLVNATDMNGDSPIHTAARNGKILGVLFFLNNGLKINVLGKDNYTVLHHIAKVGNSIQVRRLISRRANPWARTSKDDGGRVPIHLAAYRGNLQIVKVLLKRDSSFVTLKTHKNETLLDMAGKGGRDGYNTSAVIDYINRFTAPTTSSKNPSTTTTTPTTTSVSTTQSSIAMMSSPKQPEVIDGMSRIQTVPWVIVLCPMISVAQYN